MYPFSALREPYRFELWRVENIRFLLHFVWQSYSTFARICFGNHQPRLLQRACACRANYLPVSYRLCSNRQRSYRLCKQSFRLLQQFSCDRDAKHSQSTENAWDSIRKFPDLSNGVRGVRLFLWVCCSKHCRMRHKAHAPARPRLPFFPKVQTMRRQWNRCEN